VTLTTMISPRSASIAGQGNCPLTPMTGRVWSPSGLARTQVMFQSYWTVFAEAVNARAIKTVKGRYMVQIEVDGEQLDGWKRADD
jgi:hypothetical protein